MSDGDIKDAAQDGTRDEGTGGGAGDEIGRQVTEFLTAALRRPVEPDDDYFALGLADSLFALELVTFVESRFSLTVEVEDLDLDSFRTANRITRFVQRKTGSPEFTETQ
ncbi:acyl carrier protein [Streptomyces ovatisporus]|uniref:Acyl carrier protein n=1 Tax=Streptomyces ovatisporus TaxID=1128682 RepID=A0ABV9A2D4_9ACTN